MENDRPLIVVHASREALDAAVGELANRGWLPRAGFELPDREWDLSDRRLLCHGAIASPAEAAAALLAASRGAALVVSCDTNELLEQLVEDLTRLGPVEHRRARPEQPDPLAALSDEQRRLLTLLAQGRSLGEAARELHISRRTADRRLAAARERLGVRSTAEVVRLAGRQGRDTG